MAGRRFTEIELSVWLNETNKWSSPSSPISTQSYRSYLTCIVREAQGTLGRECQFPRLRKSSETSLCVVPLEFRMQVFFHYDLLNPHAVRACKSSTPAKMSASKRPRLENSTEEMFGYIHNVSPMKLSRNNNSYFNAILQEKEKYNDVVCFVPEYQQILTEMEKSK
jgi:hypothetical protein